VTLETFEIIRILLLTALSFGAAFAWMPMLLRALLRWRAGKTIRPDAETPVFAKLHAKKSGTPTMGGILIWGTVLVLAVALSALAAAAPGTFLEHLNFLSRAETLLPLGALVASAIVGFVDDYFNIRGLGAHGGGLRARHRLFVYALIAIVNHHASFGGALKEAWEVFRTYPGTSFETIVILFVLSLLAGLGVLALALLLSIPYTVLFLLGAFGGSLLATTLATAITFLAVLALFVILGGATTAYNYTVLTMIYEKLRAGRFQSKWHRIKTTGHWF